MGPPRISEIKNQVNFFLPILWAYEALKKQNAQFIKTIMRNPVIGNYRLRLTNLITQIYSIFCKIYQKL